jgi:serine phosphatase RsbU (regulator of sigma subunit)/anti-sigma regulatory factor (Ser/Thr protein kinase)
VHSGEVERLELEKRYVRKDGQVIWVLIRSRRQRDAGGGQDLMVSHFLDITARKEAERELAQAEERFRLALEGADLGTWDLHVPSGVVTLNDRYVQMLGYGEDELWRRRVRYVSWYAELLACAKGATGPRVEDWAHFLHPEDAARVLQAFAAHLRGETAVFDSEYRMRHKSGDWVWILDRGRIIERDRNGAPLRVCGTHLDITFRKVAEQALQREKQLLEEAQQRELQTGFEIQRALLIGEVPPLDPGLDIAAYAVPSRGIDGDFYAFTRFRGDCFELLVGDVMGKGVPAALVGAAVRTAYNHVVTELMVAELGGGALPKPAEIVNALHARLTPRLVELETFATLALYRFDLASGRLTFVNAGHTAGLLRRRDGQIEAILGENVPVGAVEDEQYVEATRAIGAGDSLLVYSDGITEACSGEGVAFGEQRLGRLLQDLCASAAPARVRLQALHKRLLDYAGERAIPDDETAVLIDLQGPFAAGGRTQDDVVDEELIELPWDVAGLEPLRRRVAAAGITLEADAVDRLVLAAFEVVTNVVRHVKQPFAEATLSCRLRSEPDRVTVEVWYVGLPFTPAMQRAPDLSGETEGGFGLYIIENAVTRVSYEQPMPDVCCTRLVQMSGASAPV